MKCSSYLVRLIFAFLAGGLNIPGAQADRVFLMPKSVTSVTNFDDGAFRYFTDIQVVENYAYLSWTSYGDSNHPGGLEILDVNNPAQPVRVGGCDGRAVANAIRVAGRYAYLAAGTLQNYTNDPGWLEVIDVSDTACPVRVGGIETPGRGLAIQVAGDYAYVAESVRWTGSNLLGALEIFDVTDPTNPVRRGTYNTGASAISVDILNGYAYLADGLTDLEVIDVSNPSNPRRVGGFDMDELPNPGGFEHGGAAVHIQIVDGLVYSAGEDGLYVLDVTHPSVPVHVGGFNTLPLSYAFNVSSHYACLSFWHSFLNMFRLHVYDVNDPLKPVALGSTDVPGWPKSSQVAGRFLYVAAGPLLVYEISHEPAFRSVWSNGEIIHLVWNAPAGFRLQSTPSLIDPRWQDVPDVGEETWADLPVGHGGEFFRLHKP